MNRFSRRDTAQIVNAETCEQKSSRPTVPCDGPRMNRQGEVGKPPRPFRHLRMAEHRTPDPSSSRVPVHSALVQKSVTAITNPAGRLSRWMLGKTPVLGKRKTAKSWQAACYESNVRFANGLANRGETRSVPLVLLLRSPRPFLRDLCGQNLFGLHSLSPCAQ